jgi:hypothetical protein
LIDCPKHNERIIECTIYYGKALLLIVLCRRDSTVIAGNEIVFISDETPGEKNETFDIVSNEWQWMDGYCREKEGLI